jgi:branched-chain amino acid transport system ATP-binding protein
MAPLLAVEDLHAGYGSGSVLRGVSLEVQAGEVVSLLGRNGMGKTTTVRAIMGLLRPSRGRVIFRGVAYQGRPCHQGGMVNFGG